MDPSLSNLNFSKDSLEDTLSNELLGHKNELGISLSAWEKWMIEKERKEREKRKVLEQKKREEELMRYEKLRKDKERKKKAEESHKMWLLEKEKQLKIDKENKEKVLKDETTSFREKENIRKQKCTESFKRWCKLKDEQKQKEEKKIEEQKQIKFKEQQKREQEAKDAYEQWLCSHQRRKSYWWNKGTYYHSVEWIGPLDINN